ncbi:helix-turn-helix domain-containing protein (plasmid) [Streptomyces sp. RLB1-9]|uniref:helix-turn-helix domain-containing protein n=1 Tax=Streptomyces sp. RLB1-9 TaxID=2594454 RepID=UPI0011641251|nr:helix-turn-helix transcriptional regulator [Streptomyces sp. RLB1-9]QDN94891.1 helix-turn-helix domain-containing protein [Streptomyces sp. RLB1-9]
MSIISSINHPYWSPLGAAAKATRNGLQISQAAVAQHTGLTVRQYAALESGFIPPDVADGLGRMSLSRLDEALGWDDGTARTHVEKAMTAAMFPTTVASTLPVDGETLTNLDRSTYPQAAWRRLGKAIQASRMSFNMSRGALGYGVQSTSKSILRIEEGRVYGDPRTAPPGDYQSERYVLKRLALLEMALEWEMGQAAQILEGQNRASVSPAA